LSTAAGAVIALAPMRSLLQGDLSGSALGERTQSGGRAHPGRLQGGLVVAEVLLSVMLATGAVLLIRTVNHLRDIDAGLDPEGVLALDVSLPPQAMGEEERALYFGTLVERAQALPGALSAGLISRLPLRDGGWQGTVRVEDRPDLDDLGRRPNSYWRAVTPGTFTALGVHLVQGRGIEATDGPGNTPVVVVNESFAKRMWGTRNPLGRRVSGNLWGGSWVEVVGVVADVAVTDLVGETPLAMYAPWDQTLRSNDYAVLVLESEGDPTTLAASARASSSRSSTSCFLASWADMPARASRRLMASSPSRATFWASWATASSRRATVALRASNSSSRTLRRSNWRSSASERSWRRRSRRSASSRRRFSSFSQASRSRNPSSRPASSPARLSVSASSAVRFRIRDASSWA